MACGYDAVLGPVESAYLGAVRRGLFGRSEGRVLELGVGTGNNLAAYPPGAIVTGIDESPTMLAAAQGKTGAPLAQMDAGRLGFRDGAFDTVTASLVFCSLPDPLAVLAEVRRVLKPGGRLLLLEHVRGGNAVTGGLTDLLDRPWFALNGSCHLNRETASIVNEAGFRVASAPRRLGGFLQLIEAQA